jgi:hypothetical protein
MHKSKLLNLLSEMDAYEQNTFLKFVKSGYINSNNALIVIAEHIIQNLRTNHAELLEREAIWQNCFSPAPFDDDRLRKHLSNLVKLVEQFYAMEAFRESDLANSYFTLEAASLRSRQHMLKHAVDRHEKLFKSQSHFSVHKSLFAYLAENIVFQEISENSRRYSESNLHRIIRLLDAIYFTEFLRVASHLKTRDWEKMDGIEDSLQYIQDRVGNPAADWSLFPGIEIYSRIYKTLEHADDDENFMKLRLLIKDYVHHFDVKEAKSMYEWLINYCVYKLNKGDNAYLSQLFEIYKEFLQSELIFEDGKLHDYNFKNIVTTGLRLGEYDWVQYFIESYANKVPEEQRANTVAYNSAQLNFYQRNFEGVLSHLQAVEYDDLTYNLGAKSMLMATYYEMDELEPLYSMLDSFKVYLNRKQNRIPDNFRVLYTNLIKYIKQLLSIRPGDQARIDKFVADVRKTGSVASINWLLEKANDLR